MKGRDYNNVVDKRVSKFSGGKALKIGAIVILVVIAVIILGALATAGISAFVGS